MTFNVVILNSIPCWHVLRPRSASLQAANFFDACRLVSCALWMKQFRLCKIFKNKNKPMDTNILFFLQLLLFWYCWWYLSMERNSTGEEQLLLNNLLLLQYVLLLLKKWQLARRPRKLIRPRRFGVHPIFLLRKQQGFYDNLLKEARLSDPYIFFNFTRMSPNSFDKLLSIVGSGLQKHSMREPISPGCRCDHYT